MYIFWSCSLSFSFSASLWDVIVWNCNFVTNSIISFMSKAHTMCDELWAFNTQDYSFISLTDLTMDVCVKHVFHISAKLLLDFSKVLWIHYPAWTSEIGSRWFSWQETFFLLPPAAVSEFLLLWERTSVFTLWGNVAVFSPEVELSVDFLLSAGPLWSCLNRSRYVLNRGRASWSL